MDFKTELEKRTKEAEKTVLSFMPRGGFEYLTPLYGAMEYAVSSGGKRLRPLIMLEVYRLYAGRDADTGTVAPFMAALEMIHSFSLVHDDMPEIDNDTLRRGGETVWKKYGDYLALLSGDALLNYAYETALKAFEAAGEGERDRVVRALSCLAEKSGVSGMIGGESADVLFEKAGYEGEDLRELLRFIHVNKTAALLQAAFVIGGILGGASEAECRTLEDIALYIGVAFQIRDDILDVEGDEGKLGKNIGSDAEKNKITYVSVTGMEASKKEERQLLEKALEALLTIDKDTEFLKCLCGFLIERDY
jgi:geranylgeranyl diphosphate synthase type II